MPKQRASARQRNVTTFTNDKRSYTIYTSTSTMNHLDDFVQRNGLSSRGEALRLILGAVESCNFCSKDFNGKQTTAAKPRAASTRTRRSARRSWNTDEVERLKRALDACEPRTTEQWHAVANSVGGDHSPEECQRYARAELNYDKNQANGGKRTLRSRKVRDEMLKRAVQHDESGAADFFNDAPAIPRMKIPIVDIADLSCLNTPASSISYGSRFAMDSSSSCTTPVAAGGVDLLAEIGSAKRKRANRCIHKIQPLLSKAHSTKAKASIEPPKTKPSPRPKRSRTSKEVSWTKLRDRSISFERQPNDDSYFTDDA